MLGHARERVTTAYMGSSKIRHGAPVPELASEQADGAGLLSEPVQLGVPTPTSPSRTELTAQAVDAAVQAALKIMSAGGTAEAAAAVAQAMARAVYENRADRQDQPAV